LVAAIIVAIATFVGTLATDTSAEFSAVATAL
jgi:hypothetical protein